MKTLKYKSEDGYFDIIEQLNDDNIIVTCYFSTPIF